MGIINDHKHTVILILALANLKIFFFWKAKTCQGQGNESQRFVSTARMSQGLPLKNFIILVKHYFHEKKVTGKKLPKGIKTVPFN